MKIKIKRIFALSLALTLLMSLASCGHSCGGATTSPDDTTADSVADSSSDTGRLPLGSGTSDTQASDTQGEDDTYVPFVKEPLTHMIFGANSYAQGDNLVGEISHEALPATAPLPYTMTIRTYAEWQNFYGGLPRIQMNDDFISGLASFNQAFFDKKAVAVVIVGESSPTYTHVVNGVEVKQGALYVNLTTHMTEGASKEVAYRCIMIPIDRAYAGLTIRVEHKRELNG